MESYEEPEEIHFEITYLAIPEKSDGWLSPEGYFISCLGSQHDRSAQYALYLLQNEGLSEGKNIISREDLDEFAIETSLLLDARITIMQKGFIFIRYGKVSPLYDEQRIDSISTDLQKDILRKARLL